MTMFVETERTGEEITQSLFHPDPAKIQAWQTAESKSQVLPLEHTSSVGNHS
jgi:hypothetical protein